MNNQISVKSCYNHICYPYAQNVLGRTRKIGANHFHLPNPGRKSSLASLRGVRCSQWRSRVDAIVRTSMITGIPWSMVREETVKTLIRSLSRSPKETAWLPMPWNTKSTCSANHHSPSLQLRRSWAENSLKSTRRLWISSNWSIHRLRSFQCAVCKDVVNPSSSTAALIYLTAKA